MTSPAAVFSPLSTYVEYSPEEMLDRSQAFAALMQRRRTVRQFSDRPVPRADMDACLEAAGTAPSGANLQPWHFVVISDPATKHAMRVAAGQRCLEVMDQVPAFSRSEGPMFMGPVWRLSLATPTWPAARKSPPR
jgi:nitroreductase